MGGAGKHTWQGPQDRAAGTIQGPQRHREHSRATRKTSAGSHHHPCTRTVPQHAWGADRSRPAPERAPTTRPRRQGRRAAQTHFPPSVLDRSIFHLVCHPKAPHPGDHALEQGGPDRNRTPPPAATRGESAGAIGSPAPRLRGWGSRGRPDVTRPTPSPLCPKVHHTAGGRPRAHTAHARSGPPHLPDAQQGPAGPSPNSRGEARAAVGNERHTAPPRGGHTRPPSPPPEGR